MKTLRRSFTLAFMLALLGGCTDPDHGPPLGSSGPPRKLNEIVKVIQANAVKLDRPLWSSSISVTARFKDEKSKSHLFNFEGSMLFRKPRDLRVDLRPGIGNTVMGIGSNMEDYWVWIEPEMHVMRWGRHQYSGKPCADKVPVRPDQLAAVLGYGGLPGPEENLTGPVLKAGKGFDILVYTKQSGDGTQEWERRYFVDRKPPFLVRMVNFHDQSGRIIMSAYLDDFRTGWDAGPLLPHKLTVLWPLDEAKFYMEATKLEGRTSVSPNAMRRPTAKELPAGVRDIIQVDSACN